MKAIDVTAVPGPDKSRLILEDRGGRVVFDLKKDLCDTSLFGFSGTVYTDGNRIAYDSVGKERAYPA